MLDLLYWIISTFPDLGYGQNLVQEDCMCHVHTAKLGRMAYFNNWDCKKQKSCVLLAEFR